MKIFFVFTVEQLLQIRQGHALEMNNGLSSIKNRV